MSRFDTYAGFGVESTYGTPVSPTRSFEVEADELDLDVQHLERRGFRTGLQSVHDGNVRTVVKGASGSVPLTVLTKGFGMLWKAALGTSANALDGGASSAYLQQHDVDAGGAEDSLTYQIVRETLTGDQEFTYHGVKIAGFELSQTLDELCKVTFDLDAEDVDTSTAAHTETQISGAHNFAWPDLAVTIDGNAVDVRDFRFRADMNLKTGRHYLRGSRLKLEPLRMGLPNFEFELTLDFTGTTMYDLVVSGDRVPIVATWTRSDVEIESGFSPYLKVTAPKVQLRGRTPVAELEDLPSQPLTGQVLWDGTNPAISLDYRTADSSY